METLDIEIETEIPGVKPAEQARSRELQDRFVKAGQAMLLERRLADFSIPDLAKAAKSSVGGFYSRFENKDAFFEFLRLRMLHDHARIFTAMLAEVRAEETTPSDIFRRFVSVMVRAFSGPWRGVLREAYARLTENGPAWRSMRQRGAELTEIMVAMIAPRLSVPDAEQRVAFVVQVVFSTLNNEMMNRELRFSIGDKAFEDHLTAMALSYLEPAPGA